MATTTTTASLSEAAAGLAARRLYKCYSHLSSAQILSDYRPSRFEAKPTEHHQPGTKYTCIYVTMGRASGNGDWRSPGWQRIFGVAWDGVCAPVESSFPIMNVSISLSAARLPLHGRLREHRTFLHKREQSLRYTLALAAKPLAASSVPVPRAVGTVGRSSGTSKSELVNAAPRFVRGCPQSSILQLTASPQQIFFAPFSAFSRLAVARHARAWLCGSPT